MFLYNINNNKLNEIKEEAFSKEVELHKLCEENLEALFGLQYIRREFALNNFRVDTISFGRSKK